ncbi:hypothetical protein phiOC_p019 [Ochrobactrum phage vB_OspM_OC]|nr:hypothetical protein phiOC_p019 [Ochrobactrum phage vB_OspM_OC]
MEKLPPVIENFVLRLANPNTPIFERNNCYTTLSMIHKEIEAVLEAYEKEMGKNARKEK